MPESDIGVRMSIVDRSQWLSRSQASRHLVVAQDGSDSPPLAEETAVRGPLSAASPRPRWREAAWVLLLTVVALAIRWPYWRTIPRPGDETNQATLAMHVARGEIWPLTGTDAYTGPYFVYWMAALYKLGVTDPLLGRTLLLITGTLLVAVVYMLARRLTGSWIAASVAAALIATNPHLIVLSSHLGAATTMMPFFVGLFLWWLVEALERGRGGWWLAAAGAAGLALQANLAAAIPLAGAGLWFASRAWTSPPLRRGWWGLMIGAGLIVLAFSMPVIVHNLFFRANTVTQLQARGYLWESQPTLQTYVLNLTRLALQIGRQTAGVLGGDETLAPLLGLPLIAVTWALLGLITLPRRDKILVAVATLPHLIVPWFSAHFGILDPVRFTSYMTVLLSCGMGAAVAVACKWVAARWPSWRLAPLVVSLAAAALPLQGLVGFYGFQVAARGDGGQVEAYAQEMAGVDPGARFDIVYSDAMLAGFGVPYIWEAYATMQGRVFAFVQLEEVARRLYTLPGPALILCTEAEAAQLGAYATLNLYQPATPVDHERMGFRLYRVDPGGVRRPDFVLSGAAALRVAPSRPIGARVGGLELIGADFPTGVVHGETVKLRLYWRRVEPMSEDTYTLFVHVMKPDGVTLATQVDRVLGRAVYPVTAWGDDEVVVDEVVLALPAESGPGAYPVLVGVYRYPSLERLPAPGGVDDMLEIGQLIER